MAACLVSMETEALIKNKIRLFKLEPRCHTVEGGTSRAWGTNTQLCPCCLSQRKGGKDIGFLGWQLGLLVGKARLPEREEKPVSVRRDVTVCALTPVQYALFNLKIHISWE